MIYAGRVPMPPRMYRRILRTRRRVRAYVDPYRETSVRYMGYTNEVGEVLGDFLPDWGLPASYCVAAIYILFDTLDKGQNAYDEAPVGERLEETLVTSVETLTWQIFASIVWPGGVIKCIYKIVEYITHSDSRYLPTLVTIAMIPMIVRPIDTTVDIFMEKTLSKKIRRTLEKIKSLSLLYFFKR